MCGVCVDQDQGIVCGVCVDQDQGIVCVGVWMPAGGGRSCDSHVIVMCTGAVKSLHLVAKREWEIDRKRCVHKYDSHVPKRRDTVTEALLFTLDM